MASSLQMRELMQLLEQEAEGHRYTKNLLLQSQNCQQSWERAFHIAQAEIQCNHIKLSALETRVQQLTTENGRLNMVVGHLAPGRLLTPASSEIITHGDVSQHHVQSPFLDDQSLVPNLSRGATSGGTSPEDRACSSRDVTRRQSLPSGTSEGQMGPHSQESSPTISSARHQPTRSF